METKNMSCFNWEELPSPARIEWFPWLVEESYWPLPFQHTKQCCSRNHKRSGKSTGKLVGLGVYLKSLSIRSVKKEQCMSYARIQPGASFNIGKILQCLATLENWRILYNLTSNRTDRCVLIATRFLKDSLYSYQYTPVPFPLQNRCQFGAPATRIPKIVRSSCFFASEKNSVFQSRLQIIVPMVWWFEFDLNPSTRVCSLGLSPPHICWFQRRNHNPKRLVVNQNSQASTSVRNCSFSPTRKESAPKFSCFNYTEEAIQFWNL